MPSNPSRRLSARFSNYIGVNKRSPWGPAAADFGIRALVGHSPVAVTSLDFAEVSLPNVTSIGASPVYATATHAAGTGSPSIISNALNGYALINPGSTADAGYNIQWNMANVPSRLMQFYSSPNSAISSVRDIYWGIRVVFCNSSTWDGKVFFGLAVTDTALMVPGDGTITQATMPDGIGFHVGEGGVIRLVCTESGGASISTATLSTTMSTTLNGVSMTAPGITPSNAYFHDFFFHAHWGSLTGADANSYVRGYFDGKFVAQITGASKLPSLNGVSLYNSIEVFNGGAAATTDLIVAEILNATPRLHL